MFLMCMALMSLLMSFSPRFLLVAATLESSFFAFSEVQDPGWMALWRWFALRLRWAVPGRWDENHFSTISYVKPVHFYMCIFGLYVLHHNVDMALKNPENSSLCVVCYSWSNWLTGWMFIRLQKQFAHWSMQMVESLWVLSSQRLRWSESASILAQLCMESGACSKQCTCTVPLASFRRVIPSGAELNRHFAASSFGKRRQQTSRFEKKHKRIRLP